MEWVPKHSGALFAAVCFLCTSFRGFTQNVGIGITAPKAGLHIVNNNGIIAKGTIASGADLQEAGAGTRLIWYSKKAAFRAGSISDFHPTWWNDAEIGWYSNAIGNDTRASGDFSLALGTQTQATGLYAIGIGHNSEASGQYSVVLGGASNSAKDALSVAIGTFAISNSNSSIAIGRTVMAGFGSGHGDRAIAIGNGDGIEFDASGHYATGERSFAIGNTCHALSNGSFAIGNGSNTGASFYERGTGINSYAFGNSCRASGNYSFAFGNNANTNGRTGSMVIAGRTDGQPVSTGLDHHMLMQFEGGYHFQTNLAASIGVYLQPGGNAWLSFCDSTKKENMLPMDDEKTLRKVSDIHYYSWKYKDEPDPERRNYGMMAQDFFAAFGHDALGTIGNDSLVNPIDMLGVAFSAIKALEKRTAKLDMLEQENATLKKRLEILLIEMEKGQSKR